MSYLFVFIRCIIKKVRLINAPLIKVQERTLIIQAEILSRKNKELKKISSFRDVEFSVFSQWGEDGILDWVLSLLPMIPKSFIEFGVENYLESNTRFLLVARDWKGLVIDGSGENVHDIKNQEIYWRHNLTAINAFIDKDNINKLLESGGMKGDVGLLSIDIDGNDYWVWQAIEVVSPAVVVVEYNAVLGDLHAISIPYNSKFQRTEAHFSNLYFGASINALIQLGNTKGYTFIGANSSGVNAFFVRNDLAKKVNNNMQKCCAFPSSMRESRDESGNLIYLNGDERSAFIEHLDFQDVVNGERKRLIDYGELYSAAWQESLTASI
jgi:hypothetical protein